MTTPTNPYPIRSSLTHPLPHLAYPFSYPYLLPLTSHTYLPTLPPTPHLLPPTSYPYPLTPTSYPYLLPLPHTPYQPRCVGQRACVTMASTTLTRTPQS